MNQRPTYKEHEAYGAQFTTANALINSLMLNFSKHYGKQHALVKRFIKLNKQLIDVAAQLDTEACRAYNGEQSSRPEVLYYHAPPNIKQLLESLGYSERRAAR